MITFTSPREWNSAVRYGIAPVAVALMLACRLAVNPYLGDASPFLFFFVAIIVSGWLGGLGPGLTATVFSWLAVEYFYLPPIGSVLPEGSKEIIQDLSFLIPGIVVSLIINRMRREQQRAEQAAEVVGESEQRLRATIDNAALGIVEADLQDRLVAANERMCQILGYQREELLGMSVHELTHPADRARSDSMNAKLHEGLIELIDIEKRYLRQDGSPLWVHVTVAPVRDDAGRFLYSIGTVEEISRRKTAEEQIRMQAKALSAAASGIIVTDPRGKILWTNPAYAEMTGFTVNEIIGKQTRFVNSGKQDKAFYREMWETIRRGETWRGELINRRRDGTLYHEEMVIAPMVDEHGEVIHYIAIKQDISERKRIEQKLRDSERRLTDIIEFLPDATFALDNERRIIAWNKAMEDLTGASATEVLGKGNHEYTLRLYGKRIPCLADNVLSGDQPDWPFFNMIQESSIVKAETYIPHLKPGGVWLSLKVAPIYDAQGNTVGVIDSCRDITDRKRAEEALQKSEERLKLATEATGFGTFDYYPRTGELIWSAHAKRHFGLGPEAPFDYDVFLKGLHPEDRERVHQVIQDTLKGANNGSFKIEYRTIGLEDGKVRWLAATAQAFFDETGRAVRFIGATVDVTERKRVEEALHVANERLVEADRRKDEFMAMLAHELRNPLAPIRYALQMMNMSGLAQHQLQKQREVVDRQVRHMGRLLDDLLEVSRITRGKIRLKREIVDLRAVAMQALDSMRPLIEGRAQDLLYEGPSSPLLVDGDPTRLEQIIRNLLHNANKYTEAGGCIRMSIILEPAHDAEWRVAVRVSDSGIGIDPAILPRIFEAFVQAEQGLARSQGGLGIGLAMVKNLVQMHGGSVEAYSAGANRGSEFVIHLPLAAEVMSGFIEPSAPPALAIQSRPRRVLVVDDNEDSAASLGELLALWGHEIQTAHDGRHALTAARQWQPEIILLDIGLPGMDGYEVARKLRDDPATSGVYMVALTGYGAEEDRRRALEAGFNRHMTKPVELEQLQNLLHEAQAA